MKKIAKIHILETNDMVRDASLLLKLNEVIDAVNGHEFKKDPPHDEKIYHTDPCSWKDCPICKPHDELATRMSRACSKELWDKGCNTVWFGIASEARKWMREQVDMVPYSDGSMQKFIDTLLKRISD